MNRMLWVGSVLGAALLLNGCGDDVTLPVINVPAASTFVVAGSISGLSAGGLVLQDNGGDSLSVQSAAPSFQFSTPVAQGGGYDVTVAAQPTGLMCTVAHGVGTNLQAAVSNVAVTCNSITYTVAGSISGLTAGGLVLQDNGTDSLAVASGASTFLFPTAIASGGGYNVQVSAQPAALSCTVSSGTGRNVGNNVNSVRVTCNPATVTIGGTIAGLNASGLVLQNNGGDNLAAAAGAASFQFATPIAYGAGYAVTILTQPTNQTCSVAGGGASSAAANVSTIALSCANIPTFTLTAAAGPHGTLSPTGAITVNSGGSVGLVATPDAGYGIDQWLLDGTTVQSGGGVYNASNIIANHTLQVTFAQATLSVSTSSLALATTGNASGNARQITVSNTGSIVATNVSITYPTWPSGTTAASSCGSTLAPGSSCNITVTPGATATSACTTGIAATPDAVSISASNANTTTTSVAVLGYGCVYQGGYVFAIDDTTPNVASIGGKVAAMTDQAPPYPNGLTWSATNDDISGTDETSTTPCAGAIDGACNTVQIQNYYSAYPVSSYAAGLCEGIIAGYSDWYLPAICELGSGGSNCGTPSVQNMQSDLTGVSGAPLGYYWSSTENSADPTHNAWLEYFDASGGSLQLIGYKAYTLGVRCARALTF